MGELSLKIKIGDFKFEADGPANAVDTQFDKFTRIIAPPPPEPPPLEPQKAVGAQPVEAAPAAAAPRVEPLAFDKIMQVSERTVSLRVAPKLDDAVLLILLGQKHYLRNEVVSGAEIMSGLRSSGFKVIRADSALMRQASQGMIVAAGKRRMRRYRLSTDGVMRAEKIARQLTEQTSAGV